MKVVIDTSTLISLARINYLEIFNILRMDIALPYEVYEEAILSGEEKGVADAVVIKQFIEKYKGKIVTVKSSYRTVLRKKLNKILTKGDEAVLSLAMQEKTRDIVTNDDGLGKIAMALGLSVKATPDLLLKGLKHKKMSGAEFEMFIRGLVVENRLSSVVAELYLMEGKKNDEV